MIFITAVSLMTDLQMSKMVQRDNSAIFRNFDNLAHNWIFTLTKYFNLKDTDCY